MNLAVLIPVVVVYLGVIGLLGYMGYRSTAKSADYLLGGRNTHPFIMALSYGATFISTSAIVGFGGLAGQFGFSLLWLTFCNIFVGAFIAFIFFGKRTRAMGLHLDSHTFGEFLGKRVGSKGVQITAGVVVFVFMPLYTAAVLLGASKILSGMVPEISNGAAIAFFSVLVAVYVIMGGIKGVMYTDALQGTLMFLGMIVLLIVTYTKLGGVTEAHTTLTDMGANGLVPEKFVNMGHEGWTSSPKAGSPLWWIVYSSVVLGVGIGVLAQPQLAVRYMTVKSNKELNRAVLIGGIFLLVTVGTPFIVGALSNVYFFENGGQIAIAAANGDKEQIIPAIISSIMPKWFGYVFMLVIISAAMSTLSSQFHAIGTAASRDIFETAFGHKYKSKSALVARIGVIISILITVILAFTIGKFKIIATATAIFFGIMASGFLAPYTASLFWKRLTRKGAIAGIASGLTVVLLGFILFHSKEAAAIGLVEKMVGRTSLFPKGSVMAFIDPLVFALPVSALFTVVVSLLTKVENQVTVDECFKLVARKRTFSIKKK